MDKDNLREKFVDMTEQLMRHIELRMPTNDLPAIIREIRENLVILEVLPKKE